MEKGLIADNLAIALANLAFLQDGIEHHKKIGKGSKAVMLGWIREAMREIEKEREGEKESTEARTRKSFVLIVVTV